MHDTDLDRPWIPESLAARLVPGARVRVRVSEECPARSCHGDFVAGEGVITFVHEPKGSLGYMLESHRYVVKTGDPEHLVWVQLCAAAELEPIDA